MKGIVKKTFFIILFLTSLFVLPSSINAKGTDARIDGQYPIGVSSDYMLTAGNRIRHSGGSQMSGRFMANSMAFDTAEFNDWGIWNNSLNTYSQDGTLGSVNDFYSNLWNPAVVINDFTKENTIKDPSFSDPVARLVTNIAGMWPYDRKKDPTLVYPDTQRRVKFITDTPEKEVEEVVGEKSKKLVNAAWTNNLDTKAEDGSTINGLSDLTQFRDNNITKYLTQNDTPGRSVEDDIQDVSDYYKNLAPGTSEENMFTSSNSSIIDDSSTLPQYAAEDDASVAAVVVNIKKSPDVNDIGNKAVVAASIDKQKMIEAVKKAGNTTGHLTGMHLLFNFSKEFYNSDGKLDASKIPYIVLNYKGFTSGGTAGQFTWGDTDAFGTAEIKDGKVINEKYMNEALGVTKGDWNNSKVLWMGSQVLNNFTDVYDLDNYPESASSASRDMSGLDTNAAVYFKSGTNLMYGSFIIPHGSFYAGNASGASFVGGITAANNITIDGYGAPISPDQNDGAFGVFGRKENGGKSDFPDLNNPGDEIPDIKPTISKIDLTNGSTQTISENDQTATFNYQDGYLKELPKTGISSKIHVKNAPDKFGLYYKLGDEKVWYRVGDGENDVDTNEDTIVSIDDLESLLVKNNKSFDRGKLGDSLAESDKTRMGYSISRNNKIKFAVSDTYDKENVADDSFKPVTEFDFNLKVDGTLEVDVPEHLNMGTELLGRNENFIQKININEVKVAYKKVAAKFGGNESNLIVYNPMKYPFKLTLNRIVKDDTNPFGMTKNFGYQITNNDNPATYLPMIDGSNDQIDVISRIDDDNNVGPIDPSDPNSPMKFVKADELLQTKTMYFKMPYSTDYKIGSYSTELTWNLN